MKTEREKAPLPADILEALPRVRTLCVNYPDCAETLTYGNPTFKRAGKAFVVLDRYKGLSCLWLLVDPVLRDDQLTVDGWFASPYDPRQAALCCRLDKLEWAVLGPLIDASYALAKR